MALDTSSLSLPGTSLGIVTEAALDSGVLPKLVPSKPTLFGPVKGATFSGVPRAQIVGEGEKKSGQDPFALTPFSAEPVKAQITVRVSDEFKWADEDYQLGIIDDLVAPAIGAGMGRFVDLFAFHGINPLTGTVSAKATKYLSQTTKVVEVAGAPTDELNAAVALIAGSGSGMPNGIAFDAGYGFSLASEVWPTGTAQAGLERYPGMGYGTDGVWRGLKYGMSSTVSGAPELADTKIRAIVGDYTQVKWGYQRQIPLEMIEYGNPDNIFDEDGAPRDLKGYNEIALRSEVVIYMAIGDLGKFAKVHDLV
ncbi:major capsid protein [Nocardioides alcanivorans]|uniref:major capsid protein n=1 Tax=Nocardioides alcanivorans TaxID=2897352 RepID=UPI001F1EA021|nr:major capsid protein [Nocardioides alcanivorans]